MQHDGGPATVPAPSPHEVSDAGVQAFKAAAGAQWLPPAARLSAFYE
jgi:hypothetical protein